MAPYKNTNTESPNACSLSRDIFQRYNDDPNSIFCGRIATIGGVNNDKSLPVITSNKWTIRQANQIPADKGEQYQKPTENVIGGGMLSPNNSRSASPMPQVSITPPPPAPPTQTAYAIPPAPPAPPPPPTLNAGSIPTFRLRSEIPEKCNEPPAKIQSAMTKDKKPFTYAPGGIDFSEIKSPRMQRRIIRNAQEPEDIVLPPTSTASTNTHSLPPSAAAAMMPQIAVAVFPQSNPMEKRIVNNRNHGTNDGHIVPPPPTPSQSTFKTTTPTARPVTPTSPTPTAQRTASNLIPISPENNPRSRSISPPPPPQKHASTSQKVPHGSLYIPSPPITGTDNRKSQSPPAVFPTLREAPTPWLQRQQQPQPEVIPSWVQRNNYTGHDTAAEECTFGVAPSKINQIAEVGQVSNGTRIIPVQIEGSNQSQPNSRGPSPRWGTSNEAVTHPTTRVQKRNETDQKPTQGRSFNILQKATGSNNNDSDVQNTTPYDTEGVPLSQLRKLHLNDDDQAFMNKVKAQVDDDTFLHMETDPRYRGSVIPSRAFRMLQNMTDSGQVVTGNNVVVIPISGGTTNHHNNNNVRNSNSPTAQHVQNQTTDKMVAATNDIETKKNYIPPSERQAEQELRKYMGSSIPSRSFRMLQAMTAADELNENDREIDEEKKLTPKLPFFPSPWHSPPRTPDGIRLLWQNYTRLYNFVFKRSPPHVFVGGNTLQRSTETNKLLYRLPDRAAVNCEPENTASIRIVITNENEDSDKTAKNLARTGKIDGKKDVIIRSVIRDDCDNDVSLTVCIPLKKRSRPRIYEEFYDEITLNPSPSFSSNCRDDYGEEADSRSDGSSVDFWKKLVDDEEELFYKPSRNVSYRAAAGDVTVRALTLPSPSVSSTDRLSNWGTGDEQTLLERNSTNDIVEKVKKSRRRENCQPKGTEASDDDADVEHDSGVGRNLSETDAETETVVGYKLPPEKSNLRYEKASTHSRLYKLLIENENYDDNNKSCPRSRQSPTLSVESQNQRNNNSGSLENLNYGQCTVTIPTTKTIRPKCPLLSSSPTRSHYPYNPSY